MDFDEPKIICFMCNWAFCQNDIHIPPRADVVRVTCIGRMDPVIILDMFVKGVDAVMLVGCKPPDCHFVEGNLQAERAVKMLKKLLKLVGLEPERIEIRWFSPLEERSLHYYVKEFSEEIRKLGASQLKAEKLEPELMVDVLAAKNAASNFRLRVLLGIERELTEDVNVYGEKISQEEFDNLLDEIVREEYVRHKIWLLTKTKPLSVKTLAEATGMKPAAVLKQIVNMRRRNMIALDRVEGITPLYKALEVR